MNSIIKTFSNLSCNEKADPCRAIETALSDISLWSQDKLGIKLYIRKKLSLFLCTPTSYVLERHLVYRWRYLPFIKKTWKRTVVSVIPPSDFTGKMVCKVYDETFMPAVTEFADELQAHVFPSNQAQNERVVRIEKFFYNT